MDIEPPVEHGLAWIEHFDMLHAFGLYACSHICRLMHLHIKKRKLARKKESDARIAEWQSLIDDLKKNEV
jgi:hypothetical protein